MQPAKKTSLSPKDAKHLLALKDAEVAARMAFVAALKTHQANTLSISKLRAAAKLAKQEYVGGYKKLGLNRQSAWQADNIYRGLCRLCGKEALPGKTHCAEHEAHMRSYKKPKAIVQP